MQRRKVIGILETRVELRPDARRTRFRRLIHTLMIKKEIEKFLSSFMRDVNNSGSAARLPLRGGLFKEVQFLAENGSDLRGFLQQGEMFLLPCE